MSSTEGMKLTDKQVGWLKAADAELAVCPGPGAASSCASLARKGLMVSIGRGMYRITPAGRLALSGGCDNGQ